VYVANFLITRLGLRHTFLRLKKRQPPGSQASSDALDHSVEYTAKPTRQSVPVRVQRLTGLFPGVFVFHSFASKAHEYSNAEVRDLWEYELDLKQSEVDVTDASPVELADTHLDYYYLTKNCSYHALATVEARHRASTS